MDMDLSWCPVCERAIVERDEVNEHDLVSSQAPTGTKAGKTLGLYYTAKPLIGHHRIRKNAHSARNLTKPRPQEPTPRLPTGGSGGLTGSVELTERGAVYAPRGGLYCSDACKEIDELSGQRAFEDLAVLSCFLPQPSSRAVKTTLSQLGVRAEHFEPESDSCPSTTSGTDEDHDEVHIDRRRRSIGLESINTDVTTNSSMSKGSGLPSDSSAYTNSALRPMTQLPSELRPGPIRSLTDVSPAPTKLDLHLNVQIGVNGRQSRSVEVVGLAKKNTPILLAPNGTPLIRPTFPQPKPRPGSLYQSLVKAGAELPTSQPVRALPPRLTALTAHHSSVPTYSGANAAAGTIRSATLRKASTRAMSDYPDTFEPIATPVSLATDYGLFFNSPRRLTSTLGRGGGGGEDEADDSEQATPKIHDHHPLGKRLGPTNVRDPTRHPTTPRSWSWDHLPADVPQYPAMDLARVRRSRIEYHSKIDGRTKDGKVMRADEDDQCDLLEGDEKKVGGDDVVMQTRKKLFIFNLS